MQLNTLLQPPQSAACIKQAEHGDNVDTSLELVVSHLQFVV